MSQQILSYSNRSQSCDIFVEDDGVVDGSFEPSVAVSKVSHWCASVAALSLWVKGLEFLVFRESNRSTKLCTRRTCRRMEKLVLKSNNCNANATCKSPYRTNELSREHKYHMVMDT